MGDSKNGPQSNMLGPAVGMIAIATNMRRADNKRQMSVDKIIQTGNYQVKKKKGD
jgi:hypothetical protein